jgi:hypothetical protein
MLEGTALLGICIMMVLLIRWLLAHDGTPDGKSDGLFAWPEVKKSSNAKEKRIALSSLKKP